MKQENVRISVAELSIDRGVLLCLHMVFEGAGWGQGLSPRVIYSGHADVEDGEHKLWENGVIVIYDIMNIMGVEKLSSLKGMVCRIKWDKDENNAPIAAIGHPIKDKWVYFDGREYDDTYNKR